MKKVLIWILMGIMILSMVACDTATVNSGTVVDNEINDQEKVNETSDVEANEDQATSENVDQVTSENGGQVSDETNGEATQGSTEEASDATQEENDQETNESSEEATEESASDEEPGEFEQIALMPDELAEDERPVVTIEFEDGQKIAIKLVPEIAPNTVNSFISLIESGYYDGIIFHRIIENFMIQGGDPDGIGSGGPGYTIHDEFYIIDEEARIITFLPHFRGVVSMAKTAAPDSAGSQFFIVHQDAHHLNGQYAAFGFVVEGMAVVDQLAIVATDGRDKPLEDVVMKTVTVDLNGYEPAEPVIIQ